MSSLRLQSVKIATGGPDEDGVFVFAGDFLVSVLVRLSDLHGESEGQWHVELATGLTKLPLGGVFPDLTVASNWIAAHLNSPH